MKSEEAGGYGGPNKIMAIYGENLILTIECLVSQEDGSTSQEAKLRSEQGVVREPQANWLQEGSPHQAAIPCANRV